MVAKWASGLPKNLGGTVPIAAMRPESEGLSLRGERIAAVQKGLQYAGFSAELVEVADYDGTNAVEILKQRPAAPGYACLSDAIAVVIAQFLTARGEDASSRVLGFDDSSLARRFGVTSINQHLARAAEGVFNLLDDFFQKPQNEPGTFDTVRVPLTLSLRPEPSRPARTTAR